MALPETISDITASWLNNNSSTDWLDGREVLSVAAQDIGTGTGIFGEISRLTLGFDDGSTASVVAKMPCLEPANLQVAKMLGIYDRELNMYEHVVPRSTLNAPAALIAARDDDGHFILVLDDLSPEWRVGDQIVGATLEEAENVVDALAAFHAEWWEHPELADMDWLPQPDAPQYVAAVPGIYRAGIEPLKEGWSDRIAPGSLDIALAVEPVFEELMARTATGPSTIIHTDTRLDNIFFSPEGSSSVAVIDFQLALQGRGVADLAYLIATSIPTEIATNGWEQLLRRWHDAVLETGIEYRWDDALTHYREAALYYISGAMSLVGTFDSGNDRGAAMVEAYVTRVLAHAVDCDAGSVL